MGCLIAVEKSFISAGKARENALVLYKAHILYKRNRGVFISHSIAVAYLD